MRFVGREIGVLSARLEALKHERASAVTEALTNALDLRSRAMGGPHSTGAGPTSVYRYFDESGALIYVGITGRGIARNVEHDKSKPWWRFVAGQTISHFTSRAEALAEEKRLIGRYRPPFNIQHNPDHDLLRTAYLRVVEASKPTPDSPPLQDLSRRVQLLPLERPLDGHDVTLRSRPEDWPGISKFGGTIILGDEPTVGCPQRRFAGRVIEVRTAATMLVVGIEAGTYMPRIELAFAIFRRNGNQKPQRAVLKKVVLNDPNLIGARRG